MVFPVPERPKNNAVSLFSPILAEQCMDNTFFFVGNKSGHSNLVQILKSPAEKDQKFINNKNNLNENKDISNTSIAKENTNVSSKIETKKPLEQVNISDLLALHKKS